MVVPGWELRRLCCAGDSSTEASDLEEIMEVICSLFLFFDGSLAADDDELPYLKQSDEN